MLIKDKKDTNNKNIIINRTLEQYNKKYRNRRYKLLQFTKKEVESFDIKNNSKGCNYILKGRKWALIDDTYYEIPKAPRWIWFRNLNAAVQIGCCLLVAGAIATAITIPVHNTIVEQGYIDNPTIDPAIKSEAVVTIKEKTEKGVTYQVAPKNPSLKTIVKISKVTKGNVELVDKTDYECSKPTSMSNETGTSVLLTIFASTMSKYKGEIVITPTTQYVNLNVTTSVTYGTYTGDSTIQAVIGEKDITITPNTGYLLPDVVTVTNADSTYDKTTGVIHLKNATSDVSISATCVAKKFSITSTITNGSTTGDTEIQEDVGTADVKIVPKNGYQLPEGEHINVLNAEFTYDKTTGIIHLSKATSNVTITAECPILNYSITTSLQHCACNDCPEEIQAIIGEASGKLVAEQGYKLPEEINVDGASLESYSKDTGAFKIKNATKNVTITCGAEVLKYSITNNIENGLYSGDSEIQALIGNASVTIKANDGYKLPEENEITVVNATKNYNKTTGVISLSNATGNITITTECPELRYTITKALSNCTCDDCPADIQAKIKDVTCTLKAKNGYELPDEISVAGATLDSYSKDTGKFTIRNATEAVTITCNALMLNYDISGTITNGSIPTGEQIQAIVGSKDITITPADGYKVPERSEDISVSGASFTYSEGVISLSNARGNVTITATCPELMYTYSTNITNGSASPASGEIQAIKGTQEIILTPSANYHLPDSITVTGTNNYTYDKTTGKVTISNVTGNVSITCECKMDSYSITTSVTNGSYSGDTEIGKESTATITITPSTNYKLPTSITVSGATYTYNSTSGVVSLSNPTGNVTITCTCEIITYSISTSVSNCSASGATSINAGGTAKVTLTASAGYNLPSSVSVSGASYSYSNGVVTLSNPTGNVSITGSATAKTLTPTLDAIEDVTGEVYSINLTTPAGTSIKVGKFKSTVSTKFTFALYNYSSTELIGMCDAGLVTYLREVSITISNANALKNATSLILVVQ